MITTKVVTMKDDLELLGLTEYEGRVYRALLAEHPATAYRLGRRSGVPLSRVYEVANRLVEKGAAALVGGEPARYEPVPPETLVGGARIRAARQLDALDSELAALYAGGETGGHAWLRGEGAVLSRAAALATSATDEILLAAAPAARERLLDALESSGKSLRVRALALPETARGDAAFLLLADGESALIGRLGPNADALSTRHPVLARLCADYFRLRAVADAAQEMMAAARPARSASPDRPAGWLDWEEEKQKRLLQAH
jgi:hypothetical protein